MKHGADWYKRAPRAMIDAIREAKLTALQSAIYNLVVDLIYEGAGETPNDPAYFAVHFGDVTADQATQAVADLVAIGKLIVDGRSLTQKRARIEAKSKESLSEKRSKAGKTGGKKSGEARRNKGSEAIASDLLPVEKRREEKKVSEESVSAQGARRPSPRDNLLEALDPEHADAVLAHRKAKRAPLTPHAAKLLAGKFSRCRDPNAAADAMIANGWQGFEPEWMENRNGKSGSDHQGQRPAGVVDDLRELRDQAQERDAARARDLRGHG